MEVYFLDLPGGVEAICFWKDKLHIGISKLLIGQVEKVSQIVNEFKIKIAEGC